MTQARSTRATAAGKVRVARLTDLAALGELSRLCQDVTAATRSLGLPVSGRPIGVFSLFRLPLGAFQPHDLMYVYEEAGRLSGLIRVERDSVRDEWTIVELDGDRLRAGGRHPVPSRQPGPARGVEARSRGGSTSACGDADGNVELFMQAGFARYGDERILHRDGELDLPRRVWSDDRARDLPGSGPPPARRAACSRLYAARRRSRSSDSRGSDCPTGSARERTGGCRDPASPRSSASPTSRRSCRRAAGGKDGNGPSTASSRSASRRRTSRTI
jgi:hypothetical protein